MTLQKDLLEEQLDRWNAAGLIDDQQWAEITKYERQHGPGMELPARRVPIIAEALGYLGAALAAAAVMFFAINQWKEWSDVTRVAVLGVATLAEAVAALRSGRRGRTVAIPSRIDLAGTGTAATPGTRTHAPGAEESEVPDLAEVRGQLEARRALEVALAGGHGLLMVGPPGSGKSMLAARLPGLLPPLDTAEVLEVSSISLVM